MKKMKKEKKKEKQNSNNPRAIGSTQKRKDSLQDSAHGNSIDNNDNKVIFSHLSFTLFMLLLPTPGKTQSTQE